MNPLRKRFDDYRCDKGSYHDYDTVYYPDTLQWRHEPINILEVGVAKGRSVKSWLDYFDKATVHALDRFDLMRKYDIEIFEHDRADFLMCDSTNHLVADKIRAEWGDIQYDLIIDDGAHNPRDQRRTFINLWPFLKPTGIYYVEDFLAEDMYEYCTKNWKETAGDTLPNFSDKFSDLRYQQFYAEIAQHHVTKYALYKKTGRTGNCIIKIQHSS